MSIILNAVSSKKSCDYVRKILETSSEINSAINEKDENGRTPLMWAVHNRDYSIVKLLIDFGADLNSKDNYGQTALMTSLIFFSKDISFLLVNSGADINIQDNQGQTALMLAAYYDLGEIGNHLLLKGANIDKTDNKGNTAYGIAHKKWAFHKTSYFLCEKINPITLLNDRFEYFFSDYFQKYQYSVSIDSIKSDFEQKYHVTIENSFIVSCIENFKRRVHLGERKVLKIDRIKNCISICPSDVEVENFLSSAINSQSEDYYSVSIDSIKSDFEQKYHVTIDNSFIVSCIENFKRRVHLGERKVLKIDWIKNCISICPSDVEVENFLSIVTSSESKDCYEVSINYIKLTFVQKYHILLEDSVIYSYIEKFNNKKAFENEYILIISKEKIFKVTRDTKKLFDFIDNQSKPVHISNEVLKTFGNYNLTFINLILKEQNFVLRPVTTSSKEYIVTFNDSSSHWIEEFKTEISLYLRKIFLNEVPGFSIPITEIEEAFYKEYGIKINNDCIYAGYVNANLELCDMQIVEEKNFLKSEFKNSSPELFILSKFGFECCICHELLTMNEFGIHIKEHSSKKDYCSILQIRQENTYFCNHCRKVINLSFELPNKHILGYCKESVNKL